ncbi:hypothetical protein AAFF_G00225580 [Aldrovandia affinis]|uniref:CS012 protein n=1 Tax=Aldrovandia affinis TaxID=143900 RepID=A0AAD7TB85_9TELE|nr:hypothetical protein AAFF_G00225580 [Aldrovandia affinis]
MPPQMDDVMRLCCELSTNQQIKAAVKSSAKGAIIVGTIAYAGGVVAGPPGIAAGCVVGGLQGCWRTSGEFLPLTKILMELLPKDKQKLYDEVMVVLGSFDCSDMTQLVTDLVMGNTTLKQQVTDALISYVKRELKAEVQYGH